MSWIDIFEKIAAISFFSGFAIIIIVGWAHGGKYQMSFGNPALKNPISSTGKKFLILAMLLIFSALLIALSLLVFGY